MTTAVLDAPPDQAYRHRWAALAVILVAEVMDLLDATITNIAAPAVQRDLGGGSSLVQWLTAAYTLTFAVLLVTGARLGDAYGRKRLFLLGAAGFTLASAACATADGPGVLIAARAVQGAGAALMTPQGLGLIQGMFPPEERGRSYALFGPVLGLSSVCGPTIGGLLLDADWLGTGWRAVFLVNLPLGLCAVLGAAALMPANALTRAREAVRIDLFGALLSGLAALLLVFPLVQGRELGWPGWTYACLAGSLPVLALFAWHQRRLDRSGSSPLVVPSLFRRRAFTAGLAAGLSFFGSVSGLLLVLSLYGQTGLGWTPLHSGLTLIPFSLGIAAGAILSGGMLAPRYGRRVLHGGLLVALAGALADWACIAHWGAGLTSLQLAPALLVTGLGMGLLMAPFFDIALAGVAEPELGSASGVFNATQQLGGSVGVAVLGTAFFGWATPHGLGYAAGRTIGLAAVGLALTFGLAFLLPERARPHGE